MNALSAQSSARVKSTALVYCQPMENSRQRNRRELADRITTEARHQLAQVGPGQLSLRSVARELGLASSALYRYFPSRDALLTTLITQAYDGLGQAAQDGDPGGRGDAGSRWLAVCRACRAWALAHPHELALVYGSPVPGYAAPSTTIGPAARVPRVMAGILRDALADGELTAPRRRVPHLPLITAATREVAGIVADPPYEDIVERSLVLWVVLIGALTFELFGHLEQVVTDHASWFDAAMAVAAEGVGLTVPI